MIAYYDERTFSGNGIDICSDAFGDPADPAVLLIMGAGASMLLWEESFCHRLVEGGRFVVRLFLLINFQRFGTCLSLG